MKNNFTISRVLNDAYNEIANNIGFYLQLSLIYLVSFFVLGFILGILMATGIKALIYVFGIISFVYLTMKLAIIVHQAVLLDDYRLAKIFSWQSYDKKYLANVFVLVLMMIIFFSILYFFIQLLGASKGLLTTFILIGMITLGIVFSRLAPIFADAAIDGNLKFNEVWEKTSHYKGSLFVLIVIVPGGLEKIINLIPQTSLLFVFLNAFFLMFVAFFQIAIISHSYKIIFEENETQEDGTFLM